MTTIVNYSEVFVAMETRVLIRSGAKNLIQPFPTPMMLQINLVAIGPLAAELFMFKSVDTRTDAGSMGIL